MHQIRKDHFQAAYIASTKMKHTNLKVDIETV